MTAIVDVEGIGPTYAQKLNEAGIKTVEALLEAGRTRSGRAGLAESVGVTPQQVLEWVNRADLARLNGVGSEYADLLEAAGVDSCRELAQRNAANLTAAMQQLNETKKIVRRVPTESQVQGWIAEAKTLQVAVEH